jgi:hypothetical protein
MYRFLFFFVLRAFPIARALDAGADIVITGRCVDSALALGPLIHTVGSEITSHAISYNYLPHALTVELGGSK